MGFKVLCHFSLVKTNLILSFFALYKCDRNTLFISEATTPNKKRPDEPAETVANPGLTARKVLLCLWRDWH